VGRLEFASAQIAHSARRSSDFAKRCATPPQRPSAERAKRDAGDLQKELGLQWGGRALAAPLPQGTMREFDPPTTMTDSVQDTPVPIVSTVLRWSLFCALLLAFILVPFFLLEGQMNAMVEKTLHSNASVALITAAVIVFLLADIVLPIPSSFVLTTTGYLLGFEVGTAVCFVGLTSASLGGYVLGRYAGGPIAQRVVGRAQLERFAELTQRHGDALLVAFRAMPVLAEATTILAGMARMPLPRFLLVVSIGNAAVAGVYAWIGAVSAGQSSFLFASVASIVLPVIIVLAMRRAARPRAA